ncbi:YpjP family protein [Metabacillus arenae]|uniref:YpjP family protein n=1 Tax=Metabacillus arenae TaxID=2771434 RepID=A0A926NPL1_9BACI|nr:YpjP family protein [Metabacillus arenae]MBD1381606.1 YpjP family protein [Metabacillus arenae]
MNKWLRKSLVILFTLATFGLVAPPSALMIDEPSSESSTEADQTKVTYQEHDLQEQVPDPYDQYITSFISKAEERSLTKFGQKIGPVIEDEFRDIIFPKMELVIREYVNGNDKSFQHLVISKTPSGGKSEKIFHIYNKNTGEDVIRFHVRRDHPPQQGYWFNFHYHTYHDSFQKHHDLGSIYWDKNTPPNWIQ